MSKVTYTTKIGEYNSKVYVDIDLRIDNGLSKDDYETLRTSMQLIEDIAWKYTDNTISGSEEPPQE